MKTKFFRAGVGTVIYNSKREVAWFKRAYHPVGVWQFQQGGIDSGEEIETTLWRELKEEVGLEEADFNKITEYPLWTSYAYPKEIMDKETLKHQDRLGQAHKWFFLKLKDTVIIDLKKATEDEFSELEWITFTDAIEKTDSFKKHVYKDLNDFFITKVI